MKFAVLNNEFSLRPQAVKNYEASGQHNSRNSFLKDSSVYPQDNVEISSLVKQVIQSIDSKQIELTYSLPLKKVSAEIINKDGSRIEVKNENLPKELREINNPKVFDTFLRNTYAKVSILSDGDYKLHINHKLLGGGYESGSITPTTQGKAKFDFSDFSAYINKQDNRIIDSKKIFEDIKNLEQNETFDNVSSTNDIVLDSRRTLKELQHITADDFIFQLEYQENINSVQQQMIQSGQGLLIKRFGINPEAVKRAADYGIAGDKLHYVEQKVFEDAFKELSTAVSAQASQQQMQNNSYFNNVVLVDIFVRKQGIIKIDLKSVDCPETHTVVLWKQTNDTIILIDPSTQGFSSFLKDRIREQFGIKIVLPKLQSKDGVLYGINYSGYSSKNIKGRDCIDVAVKIGFELNELQKELNDIDAILERAIKQITNDSNINDSLDSVKKLVLPFEILQSSNKEIRRNNLDIIKNYTELKEEITINKSSKEKPLSEKFKALDQIAGTFEKDIKSFKGLANLTLSINTLKGINNY